MLELTVPNQRRSDEPHARKSKRAKEVTFELDEEIVGSFIVVDTGSPRELSKTVANSAISASTARNHDHRAASTKHRDQARETPTPDWSCIFAAANALQDEELDTLQSHGP